MYSELEQRQSHTDVDYLVGALVASVGIASFIDKTDEEKTYDQYQQFKRDNPQLNFGLGTDRYGGLRLGMFISF